MLFSHTLCCHMFNRQHCITWLLYHYAVLCSVVLCTWSLLWKCGKSRTFKYSWLQFNLPVQLITDRMPTGHMSLLKSTHCCILRFLTLWWQHTAVMRWNLTQLFFIGLIYKLIAGEGMGEITVPFCLHNNWLKPGPFISFKQLCNQGGLCCVILYSWLYVH